MVKDMRVLVVDDHPLFREGFCARLMRDTAIQTIEEAGTAAEALNKAEQIQPDLVVLDISLPDKNGLELAREIHSLCPGTRIMIVSMHSEIDYVLDALHAGAMGYIVKGSASERMVEGFEAVARGDHFLDTSLSSEIVKKLIEVSSEWTEHQQDIYGTLTPRQQEVMRFLAEGYSNKKIAHTLCISPKTVENHRSQIMEKLGLRNSVELGRFAASLGLPGTAP